MGFFEMFGIVGTAFTVFGGCYAVCKWVIYRLRDRTDNMSRAAVTVVSPVTIGFERTVVVPYLIEKVIPVIVPQLPTKPTRPVPTWLQPDRSRPHRPEVPEVRPACRPYRPSWITRPEPRSTVRPGGWLDRERIDSTRPRHGVEIGGSFDGSSHLRPTPGERPPQCDNRGGADGRSFNRTFDRGSD